ncbi:MAG TPA: GNAT family N-acetyltransferase [Jiangellaceae bacterium]
MVAPKVTIRSATEHDVAALVDLGARTFRDTYGHANDPAELAAHIAENYNQPAISGALRDPSVTYVVAEEAGRIIGFAKLVVGSTEDGIVAARPAELNQLYIDSGEHGRGLGRALLDACAEHARGADCDVLWLGVWEKNPRAIRFYERLGYRKVGTHAFRFGSELQTDLLMALPLAPGP